MQRDIEQLSQSGLVEEAWYLSSFPDVAALGLGAIEHYLRIGARLGRNPGPAFDTAYYLAENPDVATAGVNPLLHYVRYGRKEGRRGKPDRVAVATLPRILPDDGITAALVVRNLVGKRPRDPGARTVLVLFDVEGYSQEEIARLGGTAVGTVKAQLHRARKLLREMLER